MKPDVNIIIIDDEEIMRSLFTDILQEEGYKVATVCDGDEAQNRVKDKFFDIAFIDVHMPVMDGIRTLQLLRKISPKTAIVMMDSMPNYVLNEFKEQGAITCIHKPFNIGEIRSVVNDIIKSN